MDEPAWWGYPRRPDRSVGTRNHVVVVPGGLVAAKICEWVPGVRTIATADRGYGRTTRDREAIAVHASAREPPLQPEPRGR